LHWRCEEGDFKQKISIVMERYHLMFARSAIFRYSPENAKEKKRGKKRKKGGKGGKKGRERGEKGEKKEKRG
jgi:hypothetical protein